MRPAYAFLKPFGLFNRFLEQTWRSQPREAEALQSQDALNFYIPEKAWAEWQRHRKLIRAYYFGSSPFLPQASLETRPPNPALSAFVDFICLAQDNAVSLRALHYLVQACRAFEADYEKIYFLKTRQGLKQKSGLFKREGFLNNSLQLMQYYLMVLNYLSYLKTTYHAENPKLFSDLSNHYQRLGREFLLMEPREQEKAEELLINLGRYKDPEAELLALWKAWVADRVRARYELFRNGRKQRLAELKKNRKKVLEEREKKRAEEEQRRKTTEERKKKELEKELLRQAQKAFDKTGNLDSLYRKVLKLCHPDLAKNGDEKALRHQLAVQANLARERKDSSTLLKLFKQLTQRELKP